MKFELSQKFYFEAAHTLNRQVETDSSRRIHGHTYYAEIAVCGIPNTETGMIVDLGSLKVAINSLREELDHRFLDELPGLGLPTLENLCMFINRRMSAWTLSRITVWREAGGDKCTLSLNAQ